jgi:hypothetical protein
MTRFTVAIALLAACGGGAPPPSAKPAVAPGDCTSAVHNTMTLSAEEMKVMAPQLEGKLPQMADLMLKRCNDDKWSADAIGCMTSARSSQAMQRCGAKLDATQTKHVYDDVATLMGGTSNPEIPATRRDDLPPECRDYRAAVEVMSRCDKLPAAARDALRQGLDAMEQGFAGLHDMPEDARRTAMDAAATGCKAATDAVVQSLKAVGC